MTTNEEPPSGIWIINGRHNDNELLRLGRHGHHFAILKRGQIFEIPSHGDVHIEVLKLDVNAEGTDRGGVKLDVKNARGSSAKGGINTGLHWPVPEPPPEPEQPEVVIHPAENSD